MELLVLVEVGHDATLSISARLRDASVCDSPARYAARLIGSPPRALLRAKSAQRPVTRLTENDPGRRSSRFGFLAIHSLPRRQPSGSQRLTSAGRHASAAALTAANSGPALLRVPARVIFAASSRRVRDEAPRPPRIAAPGGRFGFQGTALYCRRQVWFGAGEWPRRDSFLDFRLSPGDGLVSDP